jgi:hypothetical protein
MANLHEARKSRNPYSPEQPLNSLRKSELNIKSQLALSDQRFQEV